MEGVAWWIGGDGMGEVFVQRIDSRGNGVGGWWHFGGGRLSDGGTHWLFMPH